MSESKHPQRRLALLAATLAVALIAGACGGSPAAPAAEVAPAAAEAAAPAEVAAAEAAAEPAAVAMVDTPQALAPQAYQEQFSTAGAAHQLIDVRTPEEFAAGHIPGAVNIPIDELGGRLSELSQAEPVVVYCRSGNRSAQAARILDQAGYSGVYDLGGVIAWQQAGLPLECPSC